MAISTIDTGAFVARHAEGPVRTALTDTRIVAIVGPRQSGKTTLARRIIHGTSGAWLGSGRRWESVSPAASCCMTAIAFSAPARDCSPCRSRCCGTPEPNPGLSALRSLFAAGHSNAPTTLRCAHPGEREHEAGAARTGVAIVTVMNLQAGTTRHPLRGRLSDDPGNDSGRVSRSRSTAVSRRRSTIMRPIFVYSSPNPPTAPMVSSVRSSTRKPFHQLPLLSPGVVWSADIVHWTSATPSRSLWNPPRRYPWRSSETVHPLRSPAATKL